MGGVLFIIALIITICIHQSNDKKMKDVMKRNDANPDSYSKSDNWYRQHGKL